MTSDICLYSYFYLYTLDNFYDYMVKYLNPKRIRILRPPLEPLSAIHYDLNRDGKADYRSAHAKYVSVFPNMSFWRRLTHFTLPPVSPEDIK